jgi:EAL domain-containing protein (putative c-di-GMP-specific phosphodiesterase class I)
MHLHESEDSRKIVNAIMSLASSFGMRTVAEGIERDEHAESLLRLGCDLGQGYLFARPLDTDEAACLLRTRSA